MSFSSRLKSLRSSHHISQATLAEILGVTQQAVGKWEVDKATPDYSTLCNIAKYFQVSTDYLLEYTNLSSKTVAALASDSDISPQDQELLRKYHTLSPASRGAVDNQLDYFYAQDRPKTEDTAT